MGRNRRWMALVMAGMIALAPRAPIALAEAATRQEVAQRAVSLSERLSQSLESSSREGWEFLDKNRQKIKPRELIFGDPKGHPEFYVVLPYGYGVHLILYKDLSQGMVLRIAYCDRAFEREISVRRVVLVAEPDKASENFLKVRRAAKSMAYEVNHQKEDPIPAGNFRDLIEFAGFFLMPTSHAQKYSLANTLSTVATGGAAVCLCSVALGFLSAEDWDKKAYAAIGILSAAAALAGFVGARLMKSE